MVRLYTWLPAPPNVVIEHEIAPDLGHCALEIVDDDGKVSLYASYWPELDGLAGKLTDFLKHRHSRQPHSYAEETDAAARFMEREADFVDEIEGLDERLVAGSWPKLRHRRYDLKSWNCSNVAKKMLMAGMTKRDRRYAETASRCGEDYALKPNRFRDQLEWLRALVVSPVIQCTPEDVRRMVEAYNGLTKRRHRPDPRKREDSELASTRNV